MNAPIDLQHIQGTCASECHCNACILCYNAHILTPRLLDPHLFAQWSQAKTRVRPVVLGPGAQVLWPITSCCG
jgi:hypothetical protein